MADPTPTSSEFILLMIGSVAHLFVILALSLTTSRPSGNLGELAVQSASEPRVESEDVGAPVTSHLPSDVLEGPLVDYDSPGVATLV